ncbi:MAG: hypothetical protein J7L25_13620 [Deltaproteobacteria bacterium]|nr:hypothetical protein [Candidatus Tharpella aukensis]
MSITCPQCHSRCRLKNDTTTSDLSQGKCPECGHIFPIPPGINREPSAKNQTNKTKQNGGKTGFKLPGIESLLRPLRISGRTTFLWLFSGFGVIILLAIIFIGSQKIPPPRIEKNLASSSIPAPAKTTTTTKLSLPPQSMATAIAQIKHHALVGDADISITGNYLQLALLVAGNTPVTYAERLGRQFGHYLNEQLTATKQQKQMPAIKISVYYPSGTRIVVASNDQSGEEEILPQMK